VLTDPPCRQVIERQRSRSPYYWRRLLDFGSGISDLRGYWTPATGPRTSPADHASVHAVFVICVGPDRDPVQSLSLKLGVARNATWRSFAARAMAARQASRCGSWPKWAIAACDLAEVVGSAIALNLALPLSLFYGVLITGLDVLVILMLQRWGFATSRL